MQKKLAARDIYKPIGMDSGRLNYLVGRGIVVPDDKLRGTNARYRPVEAVKAALINFCDHLGMDLEAGEALVTYVVRPEVIKPIVRGDADYVAIMQGVNVIALLPNAEQLPGGPEMGRQLYPADKFVELRPLQGVTLFVPAEVLSRLSCVTYLNMSMLLRFFAERIGFTLNDLGY